STNRRVRSRRDRRSCCTMGMRCWAGGGSTAWRRGTGKRLTRLVPSPLYPPGEGERGLPERQLDSNTRDHAATAERARFSFRRAGGLRADVAGGGRVGATVPAEPGVLRHAAAEGAARRAGAARGVGGR